MERQAATDPAVGKRTSSSTSALTLAALGVVYGDIGTSPLYALREVLREGGMGTSPDTILGALSLIFWTITIVVSINYVWLVLEADNNGEGGLIAMLALATSAVRSRPRLRNVLMSIGLFGTAVFFGDGVITPAISVLSAVEGLNVVTPALSDTVVPITLVVLLVLFSAQRFGTGGIGRTFGPITLVWFAVLVAIGIPHIIANPGVLAALNPFCAIDFAIAHPGVAFVALGAVMLCITGCEALYADMGHFGKRPIRLAWYGLVMPALLVNYFGQGALLLGEPTAIENPFYLMAPDWGRLPLVVLATAATVIASQALISAAFSVTRQAIQLGFLPRMTLRHTSVKDVGQIYLPFINWALFLLITLVVGFFGSSSNLSSAYGVAVSIDMSITTVMAFFVLAFGWKYPLPLCVLVTGAFFLVDVSFLSSNMLKLPSGGWFPLVVGFAMFLLMATWTQGRRIMGEAMRRDAIGLGEFLDSVFLAPPTRVSGTAVFMVPDPGVTPRALMHNLKHNKVLHEHNVFVTLRSHDVPWIAPEERLELTPLGRDCWQVVLHFGFKNDPDVPQALAPLAARGVPLPALDTSYFLSRETVIPRLQGGMSYWREKLFASLHHNASAAADFLSLPSNRVVELGSQVEI